MVEDSRDGVWVSLPFLAGSGSGAPGADGSAQHLWAALPRRQPQLLPQGEMIEFCGFPTHCRSVNKQGHVLGSVDTKINATLQGRPGMRLRARSTPGLCH